MQQKGKKRERERGRKIVRNKKAKQRWGQKENEKGMKKDKRVKERCSEMRKINMEMKE